MGKSSNNRNRKTRGAGSSANNNNWQGKQNQNGQNNNNRTGNNSNNKTNASPFKQQRVTQGYSTQEVQQFADYDMSSYMENPARETINDDFRMNLQDLPFPIHQLLCQRNFQVVRAEPVGTNQFRDVLEDCPGIHYGALQQSLYLATCLIELGIPLFHTIFKGRINEVYGAPVRTYKFVDDDEKFVFGNARDETRKLMQLLAQYVKFEVGQDPEADSCTIPGEDIKGSGPFSHGKYSTIYLSQPKVRKAMEAAQEGADPLFRAAAMFDIAREMAHELTHAAIFAAHGANWRAKNGEKSWQHARFFFKGSPITDNVYELEHRVLGGRIEFVPYNGEAGGKTWYMINGRPSSFRRKVVSVERPQQNIRCVYDNFAAQSGIRAAQAPVFSAYYVQIATICALFKAENCDKVTPVDRQIVLRSSTRVDYRYPTSPVEHYAPLASPRLREEAGWVEAECRPMMSLCNYSYEGLPRGFSASLRVLEQRQDVYGDGMVAESENSGQVVNDIMDIDGGFKWHGHGDPKIVKSEVFPIDWEF